MAVIEDTLAEGGMTVDMRSAANGGGFGQVPFLRAHQDPYQMKVQQSPGVEGDGERKGDAGDGHGDDGFKKEIRDLEELLSKLNPMAEEFVPPSLYSNNVNLSNYFDRFYYGSNGGGLAGLYSNGFGLQLPNGRANGGFARKKMGVFNQGKRRINSRTSMAQRDDVIRRTVYVSDIDHQGRKLFTHYGGSPRGSRSN